jgi:hypothetical protein
MPKVWEPRFMPRELMLAGAAQPKKSLLARLGAKFGAKLVVDVLPAVLASVVGGVLITQYQLSRAPTAHVTTEPIVPASEEMLKLVRDEHSMIVDYIKAQTEAEKNRNAAQDQADARAAADAKAAAEAVAEAQAAMVPAAAAASAAPPTRNEIAAVTKPATARTKAASAVTASAVPLPPAPPHAPLVIAQADPDTGVQPAAAAEPAPESKSLFARTMEIKDNIQDHVVHATVGAVSAIGSIPSWIAGHIGGGNDDNKDDGNAPPAGDGGRSFAS